MRLAQIYAPIYAPPSFPTHKPWVPMAMARIAMCERTGSLARSRLICFLNTIFQLPGGRILITPGLVEQGKPALLFRGASKLFFTIPGPNAVGYGSRALRALYISVVLFINSGALICIRFAPDAIPRLSSGDYRPSNIPPMPPRVPKMDPSPLLLPPV